MTGHFERLTYRTGEKTMATKQLVPAEANPFAQEPAHWGPFDKGVHDAKAAANAQAKQAELAKRYEGRELQPIEFEAVRWAVMAILARADSMLECKEAACNRLGLQELEGMGSDVGALYVNLAQTVEALRVLGMVRNALGARAEAIAEVTGAPFDSEYFALDIPGESLTSEDVPERWRPALVPAEDIPF